MALICAKFDADLINISKDTSPKTTWPHFLAYLVCLSHLTVVVAWIKTSHYVGQLDQSDI